jgi:hypothetical protein
MSAFGGDGSAKWKRFRREVIEQRGNRCALCRQEGGSLVLHHPHYKTIGNEQPENVQLLCRGCHKRADKKRAAVNRAVGQSQRQTRSGGTGTSSAIAEPSEVRFREKRTSKNC